MHNFKELIVWKKARVFVKEIYSITAKYPVSENFTLTNQIRRAAISISNNICEGAGRNSNSDFKRFLDIALGSSFETENMIYLSVDLNYINKEEEKKLIEMVIEIQKMINGLKDKLK